MQRALSPTGPYLAFHDISKELASKPKQGWPEGGTHLSLMPQTETPEELFLSQSRLGGLRCHARGSLAKTLTCGSAGTFQKTSLTIAVSLKPASPGG